MINNWVSFISMYMLEDNSMMTSGLYAWVYHTFLVEIIIVIFLTQYCEIKNIFYNCQPYRMTTVQPEMIVMTHLMNHQMDHHQLEDHHQVASFLTRTIEQRRYCHVTQQYLFLLHHTYMRKRITYVHVSL